jgi:hypothetical protein
LLFDDGYASLARHHGRQVIAMLATDKVFAGSIPENYDEARAAGKLGAATDHAASALADRHGSGEVAAKIQAHVIVAVV